MRRPEPENSRVYVTSNTENCHRYTVSSGGKRSKAATPRPTVDKTYCTASCTTAKCDDDAAKRSSSASSIRTLALSLLNLSPLSGRTCALHVHSKQWLVVRK